MTIQLLQTWNGYPAGVYSTFSGPEEARLVGLGLARAYVDAIDGGSGRGGSVVAISAATLASPTAAMIADTRTFYELQTTKALFRSNGSALEAVGGGGGGGIALGGGNDMTAATIGTYGIDSYTAGAQWVVTYSGLGVPLTEYLAGNASLASTLTDAGSGVYIVSGGLKHVSGALVMTLAQFLTWTALVPTVQVGYRVFISDVGSFTNTIGTVSTPGAHRTYRGAVRGWTWDYAVTYENYQPVTTNSSTEVAMRSVTIPVGVLSDYSHVRLRCTRGVPAGAGQLVTYTINGAYCYYSSVGGGANHELQIAKTRHSRGPSAQWQLGTGSMGDVLGSSQAQDLYTINYATTALTIVFGGSGGSVPVTQTLKNSCVEIFDGTVA